MKTVLHKLFWLWDFDKEERWLGEMAAKGMALTDVGYCRYVFEDAAPGEYQLRLELLDNMPSHPESQRYIQFLEETGAEYLGSVMSWVYFRKRKALGSFDLFSDNASRIKHLNRMLALCGILALINLFSGLNNLFLFFSQKGVVFSAVIGGLCFAIGLFLGCGFLNIYRKKRRLQKEQQLFE